MKEYTSYKIKLKPIIVEEALRCFQAKGIRAVKMDEIAGNLSISKRTLYELYSNKEDLLIEVIKYQFELRKQRLEELNATTDNVMDLLTKYLAMQLEYTRKVNTDFFRDLRKYPKAEGELGKHYANERESSRQFFAEGVREGYFLKSVDYDIFQSIASNAMKMIRTKEEYHSLSFDELFNNFIYILIRGVCTSKGIEKIDVFMKQSGM